MRKLAVLVVVASACHQNPSAASQRAPQPARAVAPDQLARGTYLATIGGCTTCHGAPGNTVAGGREGRIGGGVWRAPNITPDRDTGIGAWTDEQLDAAIRIGLGKNGLRLAPIMPYPYYHRMTDADVAAVIAFLRAQPPIHNEVARSENLPMKHVDLPPAIGNVDRENDPLAHGEYLAAVMHCGQCHTPMMGPLADVAFAGGTQFEVEGQKIVAPNITSDPETGIGTWSEADIIGSVRDMKMPDGSAIRMPMAAYASAWSKLSPADAHAIAAYVASIPPVHHEIEGVENKPEVSAVGARRR